MTFPSLLKSSEISFSFAIFRDFGLFACFFAKCGFCFQVQEHHINFIVSEDEGIVFQRSYSIQFRVDINLKFGTCSSDELPCVCSKFQLNPLWGTKPIC